jgi:transposase
VKIPAAGEDRKFAVFGALDYASGQIVWQLSPHKDGRAFVAFLDHLVSMLADGHMIVVLDNVGYHKGRLAKDWWMTHQDRVQPLWLPAYAPQLNLMERVWGYVKDKLSCHRWWPMVLRWRPRPRGCSPTSRHGSTSPIQTASP